MNFNQLCAKNSPFAQLLAQANYWRQLTQELRQHLPPNLSDYFQVACIENNTLIIFAYNNTVAARLRMILPSIQSELSFTQDFSQIKVRISPIATPIQRPIEKTLSYEARNVLSHTAEKLKHHPDLANALIKLSQLNK